MGIKTPGWDCGDGTPDEDHDWELKTDTQGDGMYTQQYHWLECCQCGKTKEATDADLDTGDDY